jgi:hypothetical protein
MDVSAEAVLLSDRAGVLRDTIKGTFCMFLLFS